MTCEIWRDQIGPYIDGELASGHEAEVAAHLRACSACNEFAAETIHLKRAVSDAGLRYRPSSEFVRSISSSIETRSVSRKPLWAVLAFTVVIAFTVLGVMALRTRDAGINRELADLHLNALASSNPVDVISTDMHTVKPWFQGKVPFTFNLPELSNSPFTLIGGRVVYVRESPCAQLLFQYRLHRISVLIGPDNVLSSAGEQGLRNGFHLVRLEKEGYTYATIGDPGTDVLTDLAHRILAAQN